MSWGFSIGKTLRDDFDAVVDAAQPQGHYGSDLTGPGMTEAVLAAKQALKLLARHCKRPYVYATAGGNVLKPGQGAGHHDGIAVSVNGVEP